MRRKSNLPPACVCASTVAALLLIAVIGTSPTTVRAAGPTVVDPDLTVDTIATGPAQPTTMAGLRPNDLLVLEKAPGKVQRVIGGVGQSTTGLDLAVNSSSEPGLLGIALHPQFPRNGGGYLYWTESTATDACGNLVHPSVPA